MSRSWLWRLLRWLAGDPPCIHDWQREWTGDSWEWVCVRCGRRKEMRR